MYNLKTQLLYPVLLECCDLTTDLYWQQIFENLAYGKPPYGTYLNKDNLCCNYKDKKFNYKIDMVKEPRQLYDELHSLLSSKLGIESSKEKIVKKHNFKLYETKLKEEMIHWSTIKKKSIKDALLEEFVIDMKYKYSLSWEQTRCLLSIITLSINFKIIQCSDIEYRDYKIHSINGIEFTPGNFLVRNDIYDDIVVSEYKHIVKEKKCPIKAWNAVKEIE
jgi:hypothetical protein